MLYFLVYLFLEVIISTEISSYIGGLATFFEIIGSAMVGIAILMNFRTTFMQNLQAVSMHKIDLAEFQKLNLFTIIGAILLILPGFLTDIIGILLQFSVITSMFVNQYNVKSTNYKTQDDFKKKDDDVIDVEVISDSITHK
ncbi:MAG: FxsA family protein [Thiovulaceae bacterium]|nr:FxsA family protein [Sulfurimonadaceae bacterium]